MREITITVENERVRGDGVCVGAAGSGRDVFVRVFFGESWDGTQALSAQWTDARGGKSVVDISPFTREAVFPVAFAAKKYPGDVYLTLKGGRLAPGGDALSSATLSAAARFTVEESLWDGDSESADMPDPTVAEQLSSLIAGVAGDLLSHAARTDDPHDVTKAQVGLGNADNTSDENKPLSAAARTALDGKFDKTGGTLTGAVVIKKTSGDMLVLNRTDTATGIVTVNAESGSKLTLTSDDDDVTVRGVETPTEDNDAANKSYVDDQRDAAKGYAETQAAEAESAAKSYADTKKAEAISAAASDATSKANAAQSAAEATAASDATSKANAAESNAKSYADGKDADTLASAKSYADGIGTTAATALSTHNSASSAHSDIRAKIGTDIGTHNSANDAHSDIRTKIGTDIGTHNSANDAHSDIRTKIGTDIGTHNESNSAHSDIRAKIGTDIGTHNSASDAHSDIRTALAGKYDKAGGEISGTVEIKKPSGNMLVLNRDDSNNKQKIRINVNLDDTLTILDGNSDEVRLTGIAEPGNDGSAAANKEYVDGQRDAAKNYADGKDAVTLSSAKSYADGVGTSTLSSAQGYADTKKSEAISAAASDATSKANAAQSAAEATAATALSTHNSVSNAHSDIRTKIGTDIGAHNSASDAHSDIRTKIGTDIATHNSANDAHSDIRTKIGTDIGAHNSASDAHSDIRTALDAKLDKTGGDVSGEIKFINNGRGIGIKENTTVAALPKVEITAYAQGYADFKVAEIGRTGLNMLSGSIRGLRTLDEDDAGDFAANKEYVDSAIFNILPTKTVTAANAGDTINISDGAAGVPLKAFSAVCTRSQSGSGTPSPTNIMPISNLTSLSLTLNGEQSTIDVTGASYKFASGSFDLKAGVLTSAYVITEFDGTEEWSSTPTANGVRLSMTVPQLYETNPATTFICNQFPKINSSGTTENKIGYYAGWDDTDRTHLYVIWNGYDTYAATAAGFKDFCAAQKTANTPVQVSYRLQTAVSYSFSPVEFSTVLGANTITTSGKTTVTYRRDIGLALAALES